MDHHTSRRNCGLGGLRGSASLTFSEVRPRGGKIRPPPPNPRGREPVGAAAASVFFCTSDHERYPQGKMLGGGLPRPLGAINGSVPRQLTIMTPHLRYNELRTWM